MKYYEIHCYTPYCGEDSYNYLMIPNNWDFHRIEIEADGMCDDNAYEWWDDDTAEEFDYDYNDYRADCGFDIREITKEEFERYNI